MRHKRGDRCAIQAKTDRSSPLTERRGGRTSTKALVNINDVSKRELVDGRRFPSFVN